MNENSMKGRGRSSSQRSIYDYPEHLNPFYEDENHKRLRFWKIKSDKSSRSNSFSIDGLKSFWSFKSFKLKKKSSTLGINKTSESPPLMLRRHDDQYDNQSLANGQMRHTVDIGLGSSFQRGAPNRSSLQDLSSRDNFIRNNRYRSTVQASSFGSNRFQSNPTIGSITPVFRSRYNNNQSPISKGQSQISVNSNPFDDEYETISEIGSPERSSIRHSARKKRRAPQPPVSPNKIITVQLTSAKSTEESTLDVEVTKLQDSDDITNLTAEIESFVRIADTDKEQIPTSANDNDAAENDKSSSRQSPEHNDYYPQEIQGEITIERIQSLGEMDENSDKRRKTSPIKILVRAPTDEESSSESIEEELEITTEVEVKDDAKNEVHEEIQTIVDKEEDDRNKIEEESNTKPVEDLKKEDHQSEIIPSTLIDEFISGNGTNESHTFIEVNELKITESSDDLTTIQSDETKQAVCETKEEFEELKDCKSIDKIAMSSIPLRINKNDGKKVPPSPPQRRRSVREIIESINKCQSLLKVNQDQKNSKINNTEFTPTILSSSSSMSSSSSPTKTFKTKTFFSDRNVNDTTKKDYENKRLFTDMTEVNNNSQTDDMSNIPLFVEKFNELNNNNSNALFEKCVVRDESNLKSRWNPLPKPRRHRKTTNEL